MRIVLAGWGGALTGFVPGIALDLPVLLGIAIGVLVAAVVLAVPVSRSRRADVEIEVRDGTLLLQQGSRTKSVPLADVRRARVLVPAEAGRKPVGYGAVFGNGLRWTWEVPDPSLGVVRIDRGRGGLDIDVVSARPDELARALGAPSAR